MRSSFRVCLLRIWKSDIYDVIITSYKKAAILCFKYHASCMILGINMCKNQRQIVQIIEKRKYHM